MDKPIDIWFHCWAGNEKIHVSNSRLLKIITDKFNKIKKSGLYDKVENIYIVASQVANKNKFIFEEIMNLHSKVNVIYLPDPEIGNECDTLNLLIDKYKQSEKDYDVLYFHSKGLSYPENTFIDNKIKKWVRYMDLFLINDWKQNIQILKNYDTIGMFLFEPDEESRKQGEPDNRKTYAGHFWWSKSEHLKTLDHLTKDYQKGRGEFHLLDKQDVKFYLIPTNHFWSKDLDLHRHEVEDSHIFPAGW